MHIKKTSKRYGNRNTEHHFEGPGWCWGADLAFLTCGWTSQGQLRCFFRRSSWIKFGRGVQTDVPSPPCRASPSWLVMEERALGDCNSCFLALPFQCSHATPCKRGTVILVSRWRGKWQDPFHAGLSVVPAEGQQKVLRTFEGVFK